jgi:hypothetical protein
VAQLVKRVEHFALSCCSAAYRESVTAPFPRYSRANTSRPSLLRRSTAIGLASPPTAYVM